MRLESGLADFRSLLGVTGFFDARAGQYDRLRPQTEAWWGRFHALVEYGDLHGRRVLDVGCGTGAVAAALAEHASSKVWGLEPSEAMLAVARDRVPASVGLKRGVAEALPFRDAWFDRIVMCLVVHLVDRPRALAEAHRVLVPQGRIAIATFDHSHFDGYWASRFFPSLADVDRTRFPAVGVLSGELERAGFDTPTVVPLHAAETFDRDVALERLRGGHISTFSLLDPDEVADGIARAERELPRTVRSELLQAVVVASR